MGLARVAGPGAGCCRNGCAKRCPDLFGRPRTVQAFNTVTVHTRVDGALVQVNFTEGQEVKTGDLLVVVGPKPINRTGSGKSAIGLG